LSSETECISTVCFTSTETRKITEYGVNRLQATASYYVPWDIAPFLRKDNLELTLGVQVNTFGGVGHEKLTGVGVGPVAGVAFMPWQNVEVNLFKATGDNRGRFDVQSGLSFYFSPSNAPSLKMLRRKYLEVGPGSVGAVASTGGELIISPCLTCT
jgi:hypothetical protein